MGIRDWSERPSPPVESRPLRRAHLPRGMHTAGMDPRDFCLDDAKAPMHRDLLHSPDMKSPTGPSLIQRQELTSVFGLAIGQPPAQRFFRDRAMLKPPLGE